MKWHKVLSPLLVAALVITACHVTQPYHRGTNPVGAGLYRDTANTGNPPAGDTTNIADIPWRQFFADTTLQNLIEEGLRNNLDLGIAVARLQEARANFRQSQLAFFPSLNANASGAIQKNPGLPATHNYELYLNSSWQVDLWGKLRSTKRAQLAALLQSEAFHRDVQTQLVANIANAYYALMAFDEQLQITLATVENRKQDVTTTQALKEADVLTGAAVMQSQAGLYSVEVTIPEIRQNIRQTENTIALLLGRGPGAIQRDSLYHEQVRTDLRLGLPVHLLSNRPDVQEAEDQLRINTELTNVARTYFYPTLTITGEGGLTANNLAHFFDASAFFGNLVAGLTQPVFNNGINRQRLEVAKGQQQESLLNFEKILLTAGEEVSNAIFAYQTAAEKMAT